MSKNWSDLLADLNKKGSKESELELLKYWAEDKTLEKTISQRPEDKRYTFYDGPITANNKPHYGHALTMVIKDVVPRYWTMKGYKVERSLGWDCQGIPVEYEVEKKLGFDNKSQIEEYGVDKFNDLCRKSVETYQKDIEELTDRMGRWVNHDEEYATMDAPYIESLWWSLKELYNKGLLYEGYKVVPYSTRAGTTLSNSEVALGGYSDIVDLAVTLKFKSVEDDKLFYLAWTTTPWTLPGNLLLAVMQDADYAEVEFQGVRYVAATQLAPKLFDGEYKIVREFKGSELIGKKYEPLFNHFADRAEQGAFQIVHADHVTLDDGTGLVHQAAYGEEDFVLLNSMGIELFDYLDDVGAFTSEVPEYEGLFYKDANPVITEDLKKRDRLYMHYDYEHRMPMCWRTNTPLIYKPVKSWYVKVTQIVKDMVSANKEITWMPDHVRDGRFGNWLENARDWALSRKRYWGTPLPVWQCEKCNHTEVLGSYAEIEEKSGVKITDPHKPFIDEVVYKCTECDGEMHRVTDVIDVWYDSGAMPFARLHYPFENKEVFETKFPAQYIAEGIDQTRGWFYTLHVLSIALFGKKSFENVIVNGLFLARDGAKMSKSKRNYTDVNDVIDQFGADPMRLFFLNTPIVRAQDVIFDEKYLKETVSTFMLPLVNSLKYFVNYASIHNFDVEAYDNTKVSVQLMDRWLNVRSQELVNNVREAMEQYNLQKAVEYLYSFVDDLSRWYIRGSRDRFVEGDNDAMNTLYSALLQFSKVLAPFAPFLAERMYKTLTNDTESIHLQLYPELLELTAEQTKLLEDMKLLRELASLGQSVRVENGLKVRQPLASVYAPIDSAEMLELLKSELNVKEAVYSKSVYKAEGFLTAENNGLYVSLDTKLTDELKQEGLLNEFTRNLQVLRKDGGLSVGEKTGFRYFTEVEAIITAVSTNEKSIMETVSATSIAFVAKDALTNPQSVKVDGNEVLVELKK